MTSTYPGTHLFEHSFALMCAQCLAIPVGRVHAVYSIRSWFHPFSFIVWSPCSDCHFVWQVPCAVFPREGGDFCKAKLDPQMSLFQPDVAHPAGDRAEGPQYRQQRRGSDGGWEVGEVGRLGGVGRACAWTANDAARSAEHCAGVVLPQQLFALIGTRKLVM